jgi:predicted ester cyclase
MTADHRELAETFLAMLNSHDPDAVDRFVAVGYISHNPFGPLFGIPPTGRPVEMRSVGIRRVADGEFAEHWQERQP